MNFGKYVIYLNSILENELKPLREHGIENDGLQPLIITPAVQQIWTWSQKVKNALTFSAKN
jgi:hypothetical protein